MPDARIDELKSLLPRCLLPDWVRLGSRLVRILRDRHHPDKRDALLNRLLDQARASANLRERRGRNVPTITYPHELPITVRKDDIVAAIRAHQVLVLAGETGSGKTTQIPKMCLEAGLGIAAKIGCTQPRRVAALSISQRIAQELNVRWGAEVGCKIRFDDRSSQNTYVKLMTDGILLAETQHDPLLAEYDAIIIDEAHERSLNIDFLLGYLKGLLEKRQDLKLIVTSATIDTEAFSRHFNDAPIIDVSGRLYPVEVSYQPLDSDSEDRGDISYIDAAVQAAQDILLDHTSDRGDILIFMPGERDIREASDQLEGRFRDQADIVPLYGRLSAGDQQRAFAPTARRKIIIATNIAETSLTIPGIRYVVDTGLARLSRYNQRTRTRRLPVEPVSQSSANQRKGRAGRLEDGICIRLYSEEDFESRPAFTQPEIQRSNLAEVILRMKAFHLGDIETFPFVQSPSPAAIATGYLLLQELGALDEQRQLTPLGRDLARLPIDPTLGRILIQSQHEHATHELLIIAAGLSIQDPRERPLEQKEAANLAHKRFNDPQSDFLTLLNIWNAVHDQWETLRTQNQRRKFCKRQFLSYIRMREWQDLYAQLHDALDDLGTLKLNESNAAYPAIHRSILAGLLGHVAHREERNTYKTTGNRKVTVFPGSILYARSEPRRKAKAPRDQAADPPAQRPPKSDQPEWIIAGEIVETSQLFARTLAGIEPAWIFDLAPHCCKLTYYNPHWSVTAGRVLAEQIVTFRGLEVQRRRVAYGNIDAKEATEIFIRSALVEENLVPTERSSQGEDDDPQSHPRHKRARTPKRQSALTVREDDSLPAQYPFLSHNRSTRQKVETWQTRVRSSQLIDPEQALCEFYRQRIENVSSLHELNRLLQAQTDPDFLRVTELELTGGQTLSFDAEAFPDSIILDGQPVTVTYAYAPGEDHDGATLRISHSFAQSVESAVVDWAVPGLRSEQIAELLRALPKSLRRQLMPFPPKVAEITRDFQPVGPASFAEQLARFIRQRYDIEVPPATWPANTLPQHLRLRIEILGDNGKVVCAGRDLKKLREQLEKVSVAPTKTPPIWQQAARAWEKFGLDAWTFGDLPERITVGQHLDLPLYAWPGLEVEQGLVNVRLFRTRETARQASLGGGQRLVELALRRELAWIEKDLRALIRFEQLYAPIGSMDELRETALENVKRHILPVEGLPGLTTVIFQEAVEMARRKIPGLATQLIDRMGNILELRMQLQQRFGQSPTVRAQAKRTLTDFSQLGATQTPPPATNPLSEELAELLPARFLETIPFEQLVHLPRYLKALLIRSERAALNPAKDQERVRLIAPYKEALRQMQAGRNPTRERQKATEEFRWMIEEFKVSLFAQELRTAFPISARRLDEKVAEMGR